MMRFSLRTILLIALAPLPPLAHPQSAAPSRPGPSQVGGRVIRFSNREWQIKTSEGNVGPGPNVFGGEGVRVDRFGYLHLGVGLYGGRWICSEVVLTRSLGFGEYRFDVGDASGIDPNIVFGLFTWDPAAREEQYRELDIEISRWGDPHKANSQFVIQPFTRPQNLDRFELPPGRAILSLDWTPHRLLARATVGGKVVREHLFVEGIPEPGDARVRLNLWLYRASPPEKPVEVIVNRFDFIPLRKGH